MSGMKLDTRLPLLLQLPTEILFAIANRIFLDDIANLSAVSKAFYAIFDPILYKVDSIPYYRHSIYWAAQHSCLTVARKALDAGTPINTMSDPRQYIDNSLMDFPTVHTFEEASDEYSPALAEATVTKRPTINEGMTAVIELFLQAGADIARLRNEDGSPITREQSAVFNQTPLGQAIRLVDQTYFELVLDNYAEIGTSGGFSPLTLAKLAIVSGQFLELEGVLSVYAEALDLTGPNGRELHHLAYKDDRHDMCRLLYFWAYGKQAHTNFMCDSKGCFRGYRTACAERAIKAGANCADVAHDDDWAEFRSIRGMEDIFKFLVKDSRPSRQVTTLRDVAIHLVDIQLLELSILADGETIQNPEAGHLQLLQSACSWGEVAYAKRILDRNVNLKLDHLVGAFRDTLCSAIQQGHAECVQLLLLHGPPISGAPAPGERSFITEALINCTKPGSLVPILHHLFDAHADATCVVSELEGEEQIRVPPHDISAPGKDISVALDKISDLLLNTPVNHIHMATICQPGCMELLEQHGLVLYQPHVAFLETACHEHNTALVQRLINDGMLKPFFCQEALPRWLALRGCVSGRTGDEKCKRMRDTILNALFSLPFYNSHHPAKLETVQIFLKHGLNDNIRPDDCSVLEYACKYLEDIPDYIEQLIACLINNGIDVDAIAIDAGFAPIADDLNPVARSRYLVDIARYSQIIGSYKPVIAIQRLCLQGGNKARKYLDWYLARNPEVVKDTEVILEVTKVLISDGNVALLRTLMLYNGDPTRSIVKEINRAYIWPRMVAFLETIDVL